jgi:hypothetical protein
MKSRDDWDISFGGTWPSLLQRLRRFDLRRVRLGLADRRVALDLRGPPLASALRYSSSSLISWIVRTSADAHLFEVDRRFGRELLRKTLPIAVDLFDGQRAENRAQVPFQRLEDHLLHLIVRHAEEPLRRRLERRVVAADLHVRDRLDRDRHSFQRVRPLDLERDRHHVQVEVLDFLEQWNPQRGLHGREPPSSVHSSTCSEMLSASSTSMPR